MTRRTSGRVAGFAFLVYIAAAFSGMVLAGSASRGADAAARLANMARHSGALRLALVLEMAGCFCALVLAATLYALTREEDADLARIAAACRVAEGVVGAVALERGAGRLWFATGGRALDPASADALAALLMKLPAWGTDVGATFFSAGSLLFAWLFLRGRIVPAPLAGLGVFASIVTVIGMPLQMVGLLGSPATDLMWIPMLLFEVGLALWLIVRGAAPPRRTRVGEAGDPQ